ncbi:oligosaccharide flippase family protein [Flavobacterium psychrophilum]|uniref:oligosaccharide flippase family protein n=1 Tax=Flavobacterium psychrophilum TaxID=96345 RepID=UPI000B7C5224|nr:oligosaccharide flippase family protein [Flavobacterium psychrophilum]EKT3956153.1 oligosaccharide flippase family protein [Flavobacterium psychrophilum]EKT4510215.1 oligosaccharide flippase family protein [Flavobacterium psychrophilum]SNA77207.1 Probable transmembrane protein. Putative polysaccharide export protein [Flavobacterium psychrophilum]SNB10198.1 conserved membrane hypothetical protein [Flavobacterium psychrophilum]
MKQKYNNLSKEVKQSILLLLTTFLTMVVLLGVNFFMTKILDKEEFGDYSFIINLYTFLQVFFNFGFFYSISKLIGHSNNSIHDREYYGVGLVILLFVYLFMSICLLIYMYNFLNIKKYNLNALIISIPFGWIFLLNSFNELVLQGSNKIFLLAQSRLLPKFIFLLILAFLFVSQITSNTYYIILFYFISGLIPYLYIIKRLMPKFGNLKYRFREVFTANKNFGFNVYIGSLFAVGASSISGILISYFGVNNTEVGCYSIALQLSAPLSLMPNVLATTFFKKFICADLIDKKLVYTMVGISLFSLLIIVFISNPIIVLIYGKEYLESVYLLYGLSLSSVIYGIGDFFNKFLLSKGKGVELRNASFLVGTTLMISNLILINKFGAKGAALSTIISGTLYLVIILKYYKNTILNIKKN